MVITRISAFGFHGDYLSDRMFRVFSVLLYLIIAINMWAELKRDDITVCWTPANFTSYQAAYVNKVCQTEARVFPVNVAALKVTEETVKSTKEHNMLNFRKLRCLPLVISAQALLFLIPWLLWRSVSDTMCGLDDFIRESLHISTTHGSKSGCITFFTNMLVAPPDFWQCCRGHLLYIAYIIKRLLYILVCLLEMAIFSGFLEINFFKYGRRRSIWEPHGSIKTVVDYPYGIKGEARSFNVSVRTYPTEVSCEFQIRTEEGLQDHTVQCSVPPVDTLEVSLGFIWIWLLFLMILALYSFIHHLTWFTIWTSSCLKTYKVRFVSGYLSNVTSYQNASQSTVKKFIELYMKPDTYFVTNMVKLNGSLSTALAVFEGLWDTFLNTCKISTDEGGENSVEEMSSLTHKPSEII